MTRRSYIVFTLSLFLLFFFFFFKRTPPPPISPLSPPPPLSSSKNPPPGPADGPGAVTDTSNFDIRVSQFSRFHLAALPETRAGRTCRAANLSIHPLYVG